MAEKNNNKEQKNAKQFYMVKQEKPLASSLCE